MKTPLCITFFIVALTISVNYWIFSLDLPINEIVPNVISSIGIMGALISAVFVIFGYYINNNSFKESLKPRIKIWIENHNLMNTDTGVPEHCTDIFYENLSNNVGRDLEIKVILLHKAKEFFITGLFSDKMYISPQDSRYRNFPTITYLRNNQFPNITNESLSQFTLRLKIKYKVMNDTEEFYYDYSWVNHNEWQIK